jgi:predicted amidohydrolase
MHRGMVGDPGYGMATIGTYLLAHEVSLRETLARMTLRPARVLGRHVATLVSDGQTADLTVVRVDERPTVLRDVDGRELTVAESLVPVGTVRAGVWSAAVVSA